MARISVIGGVQANKIAHAMNIPHNVSADIQIRFGSFLLPEASTELNRKFAINNASHKLKAMEIMKRVGVLTVPFSTCWSDLKFPIYGRSIHHLKGKDIIVYKERVANEIVGHHDFYTQFIPNDKEFRCHVVCGKTFLQAKMATEETDSKWIHNMKHGYKFTYRGASEMHVNARTHMCNLSRKAVTALGLDFGAIDILWYDEKAWILEVNTNPGLGSPDGPTVANYVSAFKEYLML